MSCAAHPLQAEPLHSTTTPRLYSPTKTEMGGAVDEENEGQEEMGKGAAVPTDNPGLPPPRPSWYPSSCLAYPSSHSSKTHRSVYASIPSRWKALRSPELHFPCQHYPLRGAGGCLLWRFLSPTRHPECSSRQPFATLFCISQLWHPIPAPEPQSITVRSNQKSKHPTPFKDGVAFAFTQRFFRLLGL